MPDRIANEKKCKVQIKECHQYINTETNKYWKEIKNLLVNAINENSNQIRLKKITAPKFYLETAT